MSDFLPEEVAVEILKRLPLETLVRCTSVCKRWRSLIKSPDFISTHLSFSPSHSPSPPLLLVRRLIEDPKQHFSIRLDTPTTLFPRYATVPQCPFPPVTDRTPRIVGSLNGLVCLFDSPDGCTNQIFLWNPLIRRYLRLPQPRFTFSVAHSYMPALGFGFDSSTSDYKVVRLIYVKGPDGDDLLRVELFSVREGHWREIDASGVHSFISQLWWSQCFINGCVHWVACEDKNRRG